MIGPLLMAGIEDARMKEEDAIAFADADEESP